MNLKRDKKIIVFPMYHYLKRTDAFRRIIGHDFDLFKQHVRFYKKNYEATNADAVTAYYSESSTELPQKSFVLTFDDGLREHVDTIGPYLASQGIKGHFNIPTCILRKEPANPQVIHFGTAYYGIRKFADMLVQHFSVTSLDWRQFGMFTAMHSDIHVLLKEMKALLKYALTNEQTRALLLAIWSGELLQDFPDIFDQIYMNEKEISGLIAQGHTVGVHSDTHPLINDKTFSDKMLEAEFKGPKRALEQVSGKTVNFFAYPYSTDKDVIYNEDHLKKINDAGFDFLFAGLAESPSRRRLDRNFIIRYPSYSDHTLDLLSRTVKMYELFI